MGRRGEESRSSRDATSFPLRQSFVKERKPRDLQPKRDRDPIDSALVSKWRTGTGEEEADGGKGRPEQVEEKEQEERRLVGPGVVLYEGKSKEGAHKGSKTESYTPSIDQESHCSEVSEADVGDAMTTLRRWLKENDVGGLSISQTAAHVLIQIKKSENHLSRYMKKMLAEPDPGSRKERQRSILPLPCLVDSKVAVNEIWASEEFKRLAGSWSKKKGMSSSKIHREMRKN